MSMRREPATAHESPAPRRIARFAALAIAASLLAACGDDTPPPTPTPVVDAAFQSANAVWRLQRVEALTAPDGPASLDGLFPLDLRAHYVGSDPGSGLRLAHGPAKLGLLRVDGQRVSLEPERGVVLTEGGEPLPRGRIALRDDRDPQPTVLGFDDGKGLLAIVERAGRPHLRVWHQDAATRTQIGRIDYWPVDPAWRIAGRFEPYAAGRTIDIGDILGHARAMPTPGAVVFGHGGATHRLEALEGPGGGLRLLFADRTSGHDSFGAGRELLVAPAAMDGSVVLDFNRAGNPPCAFTAFSPCLLLPAGNRLDIAVTAGEKRHTRPRTTP